MVNTPKVDERPEPPKPLRINAANPSPHPLAELWEYRELLVFLTWRDIAVRYKQTALGVLWALLQPALLMVVFTIVMGRVGGASWPGRPYPLFVLCGLVPWQLFAFALTSSANSVVSNERLVTKVYFPRLIIPLASVLAGVVDFLVAFLLLVVAMVHYGAKPGIELLGLPLLMILAVLAALAVGLGLSALVVEYRDVRHALPFLTQLWLLASPIGYPLALVPSRWQTLAAVNPMTGIVEGFRWALLGQPFPARPLLLAVLFVGAALLAGVLYFGRIERTLADVI